MLSFRTTVPGADADAIVREIVERCASATLCATEPRPRRTNVATAAVMVAAHALAASLDSRKSAEATVDTNSRRMMTWPPGYLNNRCNLWTLHVSDLAQLLRSRPHIGRPGRR